MDTKYLLLNHQYSARQHMTCLIATIKTLKTFWNVSRLMFVGNQKFSVGWDIVFVCTVIGLILIKC